MLVSLLILPLNLVFFQGFQALLFRDCSALDWCWPNIIKVFGLPGPNSREAAVLGILEKIRENTKFKGKMKVRERGNGKMFGFFSSLCGVRYCFVWFAFGVGVPNKKRGGRGVYLESGIVFLQPREYFKTSKIENIGGVYLVLG